MTEFELLQLEDRVTRLEAWVTDLKEWTEQKIEAWAEGQDRRHKEVVACLQAVKDQQQEALDHVMTEQRALSHREATAIALRVPESGTEWIDEMIRKGRGLSAKIPLGATLP